MEAPAKQIDALLKAIAPKLRAEFSLKKLNRTFYRYVADTVQGIGFTPSNWNREGQVSFTGHYQVGHIFESRLYQNTDGPIDPTRIQPFESGQIGRWEIQGGQQVEEAAGRVLTDIQRTVSPVFAAFGAGVKYARALQIHPEGGDGGKLRLIKMAIYSGEFGAARREVDRILDKEDFDKEDVWLRGQVRLLCPYLEGKTPNQSPEPTAPSGRGSP